MNHNVVRYTATPVEMCKIIRVAMIVIEHPQHMPQLHQVVILNAHTSFWSWEVHFR